MITSSAVIILEFYPKVPYKSQIINAKTNRGCGLM